MLIHEEGSVQHIYRDQAGLETVCVGHLIRPQDRDIIEDGVTAEECDSFLRNDLKEAERVVNAEIDVPISQNMFDAMVSLAFNIGSAQFLKSSVLRYVNARAPQLASAAFTLWVKRKDPKTGQLVVDAGLVARRQREAALFLTPDKMSDGDVAAMWAAIDAAKFDLTDLIDWGSPTPRQDEPDPVG